MFNRNFKYGYAFYSEFLALQCTSIDNLFDRVSFWGSIVVEINKKCFFSHKSVYTFLRSFSKRGKFSTFILDLN